MAGQVRAPVNFRNLVCISDLILIKHLYAQDFERLFRANLFDQEGHVFTDWVKLYCTCILIKYIDS